MIAPPAYERETIIRWDEDEKVVYIYTSSNPVIRRLNSKLKLKIEKEIKNQDGVVTGVEFKLPLKEFRFGLRKKYSQERLEALHERTKKMKEKK